MPPASRVATPEPPAPIVSVVVTNTPLLPAIEPAPSDSNSDAALAAVAAGIEQAPDNVSDFFGTPRTGTVIETTVAKNALFEQGKKRVRTSPERVSPTSQPTAAKRVNAVAFYGARPAANRTFVAKPKNDVPPRFTSGPVPASVYAQMKKKEVVDYTLAWWTSMRTKNPNVLVAINAKGKWGCALCPSYTGGKICNVVKHVTHLHPRHSDANVNAEQLFRNAVGARGLDVSRAQQD